MSGGTKPGTRRGKYNPRWERHPKPCANDCGKMVRPVHTTRKQYPNTVCQQSRGLCTRCYYLLKEVDDLPESKREIPDAKIQEWRDSLNSWLQARRIRLGAEIGEHVHVVGIDSSTCGACVVGRANDLRDWFGDPESDGDEAQAQDGGTGHAPDAGPVEHSSRAA